MNIVLDTNVIVAGLRSKNGASFQLLGQIAENKVNFVLSVTLFLEYEAVLKRETFLTASGLKDKDIDTVLDMLASKCMETRIYYLWRPQLKDPNDEMVLETAVSGDVDAIVTFNKKDFIEAAKKFDLKIISPSEYLTKSGGYYE